MYVMLREHCADRCDIFKALSASFIHEVPLDRCGERLLSDPVYSLFWCSEWISSLKSMAECLALSVDPSSPFTMPALSFLSIYPSDSFIFYLYTRPKVLQ